MPKLRTNPTRCNLWATSSIILKAQYEWEKLKHDPLIIDLNQKRVPSSRVSGFVEARTFGRGRWERPVEAMEKKAKKSVMTLPDMGLDGDGRE